METCEESIFKADLNILQYRYLTGVYRLSPTLDQNLSRIQMRVKEQKDQHATRTYSGRSTTLERSLNVNALCHLGWGIRYLSENHHEKARHATLQLWTRIPVHKYIKPVRLGCPQLWT